MFTVLVAHLAEEWREDGHFGVEDGVTSQCAVVAHLLDVVHQQEVPVVAGDGVPLGGVVTLRQAANKSLVDLIGRKKIILSSGMLTARAPSMRLSLCLLSML